MSEYIEITQIDAMKAVQIENATLRRIDTRLVDHGLRVAYIACKICQAGNLSLNLKTLFLLCAFHDIGAYKTDEIDRLLEFETYDVWNHSIYGYLFMKYLTPLNDYAEAVLYHHSSQKDIEQANLKYGDYASLIHLADRIDVVYTYQRNEQMFDRLFVHSGDKFLASNVAIANQLIKEGSLLSALSTGTYLKENRELLTSFITSSDEALDYLKMVIYSIDFRSECTVTHTINTVSLAVYMARHYGLPETECENIYLGALLHDIGKVAIPVSILEHPGRLNDDKMSIMRSHVEETERIIKEIVPPYICDLALRHHEKLDGSGYPYGLSAKDLTFSQRIIAVADVVSALSSRRSYKEPFPKEKTLDILKKMSHSELDPMLCDYVCSNYDHLIKVTEKERNQVIDKYKHITEEYQELQKVWRACK